MTETKPPATPPEVRASSYVTEVSVADLQKHKAYLCSLINVLIENNVGVVHRQATFCTNEFTWRLDGPFDDVTDAKTLQIHVGQAESWLRVASLALNWSGWFDETRDEKVFGEYIEWCKSQGWVGDFKEVITALMWKLPHGTMTAYGSTTADVYNMLAPIDIKGQPLEHKPDPACVLGLFERMYARYCCMNPFRLDLPASSVFDAMRELVVQRVCHARNKWSDSTEPKQKIPCEKQTQTK